MPELEAFDEPRARRLWGEAHRKAYRHGIVWLSLALAFASGLGLVAAAEAERLPGWVTPFGGPCFLVVWCLHERFVVTHFARRHVRSRLARAEKQRARLDTILRARTDPAP